MYQPENAITAESTVSSVSFKRDVFDIVLERETSGYWLNIENPFAVAVTLLLGLPNIKQTLSEWQRDRDRIVADATS